MAQEQSPVEQAVSRALRENLERIQHTANELQQAVNDVTAACASTKPANTLPPMLRAQTAAASLAAALDVLSRLVASSLHISPRSPLEAEMTHLAAAGAVPAAPPSPAPRAPAPPPPVVEEYLEPVAEEAPAELAAPPEEEAVSAAEQPFDLNRLSTEEQELHRRANRVAKVSMQDIKMLKPDQVKLGRENKDICIRLRDDIDKAHREYDRRFKPIMAHPVDYFYHWMVQILADGDAKALGDYPYRTHAGHA
ncbi:MAG: hypothetical protein LAN84_12515 [Acidobacteriia bacterium]|nr:hypothetical protein [Terriglobia bacterium]